MSNSLHLQEARPIEKGFLFRDTYRGAALQYRRTWAFKDVHILSYSVHQGRDAVTLHLAWDEVERT